MPKMKTNSGAKKRFRFTATGKIKRSFANKRHGLVKRTQAMKRQARGTTIVHESDVKLILNYLPNR